MAELKTKLNDGSVNDFLSSVEDEKKRADAFSLYAMMEKATGEPGKMWGDSIVGFGSYHYKYASGKEGDWMLTGFSPRKQNISVYFMDGFDKYEEPLGRLGKHKTSKACLYIKRLSDIDEAVLEEMVVASAKYMREKVW
ncbi:MAG: DUF1801 domain-containing protein [Bacteroidia bacterium]